MKWLYFARMAAKIEWGRDSNILRTVRTNNENHPTEKPVNLIRYFIEKRSEKGDVVLDTFAGSFSTAKAAKETGRDFYALKLTQIIVRGQGNC